MDIPWLALGVVLGVGLVLLVGAAAAALRRRSHPVPDEPGGDDLPGFLESPPGSTTPVPVGWAALSAVPASTPAPPPAPTTRRRRDIVIPLAAMVVAAVLLLGVAVAATSRPDERPTPSRSPSPAGWAPSARLTFGGVVLEPRAVGVTATYPVVQLSTEDGRTVGRIEFPTFNCLTSEAPADPVAAGCVPAVPEYAELRSPELVVRADGDGLDATGRFPTEVRPNGSPPTATGRSYALHITVTPSGGPEEDGWRPAHGTLELGSGRALTVDRPGVNVLRAGS